MPSQLFLLFLEDVLVLDPVILEFHRVKWLELVFALLELKFAFILFSFHYVLLEVLLHLLVKSLGPVLVGAGTNSFRSFETVNRGLRAVHVFGFSVELVDLFGFFSHGL